MYFTGFPLLCRMLLQCCLAWSKKCGILGFARVCSTQGSPHDTTLPGLRLQCCFASSAGSSMLFRFFGAASLSVASLTLQSEQLKASKGVARISSAQGSSQDITVVDSVRVCSKNVKTLATAFEIPALLSCTLINAALDHLRAACNNVCSIARVRTRLQPFEQQGIKIV